MNTKQVIVIRRYFPNENGELKTVRTGKMVAQACHASMAFLTEKIKNKKDLSKNELEWINSSFAKICVYVDTEEELIEIYNNAKNAKLNVHMITDSGRTEFHGIPTKTCLAIGPDESSAIDKITGHLKLM